MPTTVLLPSNFNLHALDPFAGAVISPNGLPVDRELIFDFKHLSFIDGSGLTAFCNTLEWLFSQGVHVYFSNYQDFYRGPISYLDDCGFFQRYLGGKLRPTASIKATSLPCTQVAHADGHGWIERRFTPWMASRFNVPPAALGSVRTCVKEIFNNIIDHSTKNIGFVHVQHYPKMKEVKITISDFGKGIPNNVRKLYPELSDAQAILQASAEGFTTKSTERNMGVGLDFLISNILGNNGAVSILSYRGLLLCYNDRYDEPQRVPRVKKGVYPGTLVDILLRTECFVGDEVEEEELVW